ncbi:hypothetical protein BCF33_2760 [Hasllibacter halocynthiae]|uniref:Pirin family protein n=1 Tax=Hasllibacter halocynthiae TaxID=595589 RepID=A0A2T0WZD0_9RHOB|nr:pirin-like C-terminal cupin domain-containing protein [Hasllibacter halocynthiae]PRY92066.1 hypothetical protein BCF33_2760 [Hasllibacter halocynthiae]
MTDRTAETIVAIPKGFDTPALSTRDVTRGLVGARMDPFLVASHFDMRGPVFPPHPHAGFAVMTYILPESETAFLNQDSTGFVNTIAPGELHVTLAGRGLQHEETNVVEGRSALGFQIWIDLPDANRQDAPRAIHVTNDRIPISEKGGARIRVVAGASNGMETQIGLPTPFRLVDATLAPGARFAQDLEDGEHAYLHVLSGEAAAGGGRARADEALFTAPGGTRLTVEAGAEGARLVLFAGCPLHREPILGGPFVASTVEELQGFRQAFAAGLMGALTAFADRRAG